ncbi:MAG: response regulator [Bacteroidota bacterium]
MDRTILVVDDSATVRKFVSVSLSMQGFRVVTAEDGMDALEKLPREHVDLIITDLNMPNMSGIELIARLKDRLPETPIVVISGTADMQSAIEAIRCGAWEYLIKPIDFGSLHTSTDTLTFSAGDGHDTVTNFNTAHDVIDISSFGLGSFANVASLITEVGVNAVINFATGEVITLTNVDQNNLHSSNFLV